MRRDLLLAAAVLCLGPAALRGAEPHPPPGAPATWTRGIDWPGAGGWEWLRTADDGSAVWLFTRQDAERSGSTLSVRRRIEYRDPQPGASVSPLWSGSYLSLVEQLDVDCAAATERRRSVSAFRGRNMTDPIQPPLVLDPAQRSSQPAIPGTQPATFVQQVCARFGRHYMKPY